MSLSIGFKNKRTATALENKIIALIDNDSITSWTYDADNCFTHKSRQWYEKAWIQLTVNEENPSVVQAEVIESNDVEMSKALYATYITKFAYLIMTQFHNRVKSIELTPFSDCGD